MRPTEHAWQARQCRSCQRCSRATLQLTLIATGVPSGRSAVGSKVPRYTCAVVCMGPQWLRDATDQGEETCSQADGRRRCAYLGIKGLAHLAQRRRRNWLWRDVGEQQGHGRPQLRLKHCGKDAAPAGVGGWGAAAEPCTAHASRYRRCGLRSGAHVTPLPAGPPPANASSVGKGGMRSCIATKCIWGGVRAQCAKPWACTECLVALTKWGA